MSYSFKAPSNPDEIDIKIIIRAALSYYNKLYDHITGKHNLSPETIKFISERLLEQVMILEHISDNIYEQLTPEEKNILALMEEKRNENLYGPDHHRDVIKQQVDTLLANSEERYDQIRQDAIEKVNRSREDYV